VPDRKDTLHLRLVKMKCCLKSIRDTAQFTDTSPEPDEQWHVCYLQDYVASWLPRHCCAKNCSGGGWISNTAYTNEIITLISELPERPFVLVFVSMSKMMLKVWFLSTSCEYGFLYGRKEGVCCEKVLQM
jgi:hypothetical protein